jgi:hypothetical protein
MSFTSSRTYANPFIDVTVTVEYAKQGSPTIRSLAFWDGGNTFKMRMAFPEAGTWTYRTTSSDTANTRLHNQTGTVQVRPYKGSNQLYQHGFLRVSANRRFLEHADGTPFFWLGDTLWGATVWLSENGFRQAIDDLAAKRFTVLQTNFARKSEVDTNGMVPYDTGTRQWNVAFMQIPVCQRSGDRPVCERLDRSEMGSGRAGMGTACANDCGPLCGKLRHLVIEYG